jgi:membrane protease YdiL (CAAX protease family)
MVLLELALISILAAGTYYVLSTSLKSALGEFTSSAVGMSVSFLAIPAICLAFGIPSKRGPKLGKIDSKFAISLLLYQVFTLWLMVYIPRDPGFFSDFSLGSSEHVQYIITVGFYVPPVDFFTRRFIQSEVTHTFGPWAGFWAGTIAWIVGHILELVWLSELMGPAGSATFIVVSGLVTGLLYMRYKNVLGLMTGHWLVNVILSLAPALF